jgi:hypothetical protein
MLADAAMYFTKSIIYGAARKADIDRDRSEFQGVYDRVADLDETALAVLALLACVAHRLECGDFVN